MFGGIRVYFAKKPDRSVELSLIMGFSSSNCKLGAHFDTCRACIMQANDEMRASLKKIAR